MFRCPGCGRKVDKTVNYCPYCGKELKKSNKNLALELEESIPILIAIAVLITIFIAIIGAILFVL